VTLFVVVDEFVSDVVLDCVRVRDLASSVMNVHAHEEVSRISGMKKEEGVWHRHRNEARVSNDVSQACDETSKARVNTQSHFSTYSRGRERDSCAHEGESKCKGKRKLHCDERSAEIQLMTMFSGP
jgi:hypothetical protein